MESRLNVLFIGIDTLRADHLGCYGYVRRTSPNIDRLASRGVLFSNAFAPAIPTDPGWTTLFTGVHPLRHCIVSHAGDVVLSEDIPLLSQVLKKHDYVTVAVDNLHRWFERGYDYYLDPGYEEAPSGGRKVTADRVNSRAVEWLRGWASRRRGDERFFMFVHYWDPHTPYVPPSPYDRMFYKGDERDPRNPTMRKVREISPIWFLFERWLRGITDVEYVVAQYDGEIAYVDSKVGELLEVLDELGLVEETLVVLTSDHGELMIEHDIYFDHHGLYDPNVRVPLAMSCPGILPHGVVVDAFVQHVDVAPTILGLLGLGHEWMDGMDLMEVLYGGREGYREVYLFENTWMCKRAIRTRKWKLIKTVKERDLYGRPVGWLELYDLERDPYETTNLAASEVDVARSLERQLEAWVRRALGDRPDPQLSQRTSLRSRFLEKLRQCGRV